MKTAKALARIFGANDQIFQDVNINFFYQKIDGLFDVVSVGVVEELNFRPSDLKQDLTTAIAAILNEPERKVWLESCEIEYSIIAPVHLVDFNYPTEMLFV